MKSFFLLATALSLVLIKMDLSRIRAQYRDAATQREKAEQLHRELQSINMESSVILVAYKGAASTLMAKYAKSVKEKKIFFRRGIELLEYAVEKAPKSVEIRYLRLSVKENAPRITGYKKHLDKDKTFILQHLSEVADPESKEYIKGYISQSKLFDTNEKQKISRQ